VGRDRVREIAVERRDGVEAELDAFEIDTETTRILVGEGRMVTESSLPEVADAESAGETVRANERREAGVQTTVGSPSMEEARDTARSSAAAIRPLRGSSCGRGPCSRRRLPADRAGSRNVDGYLRVVGAALTALRPVTVLMSLPLHR